MRSQSTNVTVVLLGAFQPESFLPSALADANVVSRSEANAAKMRALLPGTALEVDLLWGQLAVTQERFQAGAREAPYVRICDLTIKALRDIEAESSVTAFGINVESHFDLGSPSARNVIGCSLAPPDAWGQWGREILVKMKESSGMVNLLHGGMVNLQMRQPFREESISGWMDVYVGPSQRIPNESGVFFRTNHHHQFLAESRPPQPSLVLLEELGERFDASVQAAESIFIDVLSKYTPA
jgi:hypothetical protein